MVGAGLAGLVSSLRAAPRRSRGGTSRPSTSAMSLKKTLQRGRPWQPEAFRGAQRIFLYLTF